MNTDYALSIVSSQNYSINENSFTNNKIGILCSGADNGTFSGNSFINNTGYGIDLKNSENCTLYNNTMKQSDMYGCLFTNIVQSRLEFNTFENLFIGCQIIESNTISFANNSIVNCTGSGLRLNSSGHVIIIDNSFVNNSGTSLDILNSQGNKIYYNSFIENRIQASDDGDNQWDNGYPFGGNYWSDYTGVDMRNGASQNITGHDGIGDEPYTNISGQGIGCGEMHDHYPLMTSNFSAERWIPDENPPVSRILATERNWHNDSYAVGVWIYSEVFENESQVYSVDLYYQHTMDNGSWSNTNYFGTVYGEMRSWRFDWPDGEGYYRFLSIAHDRYGNNEVNSTFSEWCGYDVSPPTLLISGPNIATIGDEVNFTVSSEDAYSGIHVIQVTIRYSMDNISWEEWSNIGTTNESITNWSMSFPEGAGYYEILVTSSDKVGNKYEVSHAIQIEPAVGFLNEFWWVILLVSITIVSMLALVFIVWKGRQGSRVPPAQHE
jgi:parallel beta-helix repeat protein